MESLVISVHVLAAIAITGLVLLQQGKGADMGASFGSGASQTIFGSGGSGNALTRATTWLAVVFFLTSLFLAYTARQQADSGMQESSLLENSAGQTRQMTPPESDELPQAPAGAADNTGDLPSLGDIPEAPTGGDDAGAGAGAGAGESAGVAADADEPAAEAADTGEEAPAATGTDEQP